MTARLRLSLLLAACAALALPPAQAQTQEPPAAPAARKIAVTSLVGDQMAITVYRERAGTNMPNPVNHLKMPGPIFDESVLRAVSTAIENTSPKPTVAMLRVPTAGTDLDPARFVVDGKVDATNRMIDALRKQGFTHLVTATKLRSRNTVSLADNHVIGTGTLEGVGFYIDYTLNVERVGTQADRGQGIIAPHVYLQLSLIDLAALEVRSRQAVTASALRASSENPNSTDPWGAMSSEEKIEAINRLIARDVGPATAALFAPK